MILRSVLRLKFRINWGLVRPSLRRHVLIERRHVLIEQRHVLIELAGDSHQNPKLRTTAPSVYAIGDVINRMQLTPVALSEGHCLSDTLFGGKPRKTDYTDVPTAVFSHPNIGTVGLTEEQARKEYGEVHIYRSYDSSPLLFPRIFAPFPQTVRCLTMFCP